MILTLKPVETLNCHTHITATSEQNKASRLALKLNHEMQALQAYKNNAKYIAIEKCHFT